MLIDDRLEKLSDLVRSGVPISMFESVEVIEYQRFKKLHSPNSRFVTIAAWLKTKWQRLRKAANVGRNKYLPKRENR